MGLSRPYSNTNTPNGTFPPSFFSRRARAAKRAGETSRPTLGCTYKLWAIWWTSFTAGSVLSSKTSTQKRGTRTNGRRNGQTWRNTRRIRTIETGHGRLMEMRNEVLPPPIGSDRRRCVYLHQADLTRTRCAPRQGPVRDGVWCAILWNVCAS
jgi:hypothetical protein